jgi:hypothetical protein
VKLQKHRGKSLLYFAQTAFIEVIKAIYNAHPEARDDCSAQKGEKRKLVQHEMICL